MSDPAEAASAREHEREPARAGAANAPGAHALREAHVLRVRLGHGANCSSIGSLVDTMFAVATIGGAVFASVVAALGTEPVHVAGAPPSGETPASPAHDQRPADPPDP